MLNNNNSFRNILYETPENYNYFIGYHDICPWDQSNKRLLLHKVDLDLRQIPTGTERIDICLWTPESGTISKIGETRAWNWQIGARAQWMPKKDNLIIYNVLRDGSLKSLIVDVATGKEKELHRPIFSLSPDGKRALTVNYARLAVNWPAYGYAGSSDNCDTDPSDDGIWLIDMEKDKSRLVLSLEEIADFTNSWSAQNANQFVVIPKFNPSGKSFVFYYRYFLPDGALYSHLFFCDVDGSNLHALAEEKVSHFDWLSDDTIMVWTRSLPSSVVALRKKEWMASPLVDPIIRFIRRMSPGLKQRIFNEHYYLVDTQSPEKRVAIKDELLDQDGHPMFTRDRRRFVTDTYPDDDGMQRLMIYDLDTKRCSEIGRFYSNSNMWKGDTKCDLHPRWDRGELQIAIDSARRKVRQVLIIRAESES